MSGIVTYELTTGRIIQFQPTPVKQRSWEAAEDTIENWPFPHQGPLEIYYSLDLVTPGDSYMDSNHVVQARTPFPALTITNGLVQGVPAGTTVIWPDWEETLEMDGEFELESNVSGTFTFRLDHPRYIPYQLELEYNV